MAKAKSCADQVIAVPAALMASVQRVPVDAVEAAYATGKLQHGGAELPFYWLGALLQAGGHIGSMAKTQMASSVIGLLIGLPFIYCFGSVGIALSLLLAALATAAVTWRAATKPWRKLPSSDRPSPPWT